MRSPLALLALCLDLGACASSAARRPAEPAADEPAPIPAGASAPDAGVDVDAAPCDVVGTWSGTVGGGILQGQTMSLTFAEDGTARGTVDWVTLETLWTREGEHVLITDVRAVPALASCPPDVVGRYRIEFEPGCTAVRVVEGEDPCRHRYLALVGLVGTRR